MDLGVELLGDRIEVPCLDGSLQPYLSLDAAASTGALPQVATRIAEFLPWYSSIHRGAGYKSQLSSAAYESARRRVLEFTRHGSDEQVAIFCKGTTEAINQLAYRLRLGREDVVVTTVVEHHANLLPWTRFARCRFVECGAAGTFDLDDVCAALDQAPRPVLLAMTGASNVTGWVPPLDAIIDAAHERGIPVMIDAAQLAPHRPLPPHADFVVFSGHKMYAPFGSGALVGPRAAFADGDPFLAGGGAVEMVDLDEVVWSSPPAREEAGSPNLIGAVALAAAIDELDSIGWPRIMAHDEELARMLREGLAALPGVRVLGPPVSSETLPVASFVVDGMPHALVAARLSAEFAIGVRHGCFCAHPYLVRLLGLDAQQMQTFRMAARRGDHRDLPGAVRVSGGISTTAADVVRLLEAVRLICATEPGANYVLESDSGDYWPEGLARVDALSDPAAGCVQG